MRTHVLLGLACLTACLLNGAHAATVTVSDGSASLSFHTDDTASNLGTPSDPVRFARTLEWTANGRRILVYPTSYWLDIEHMHAGAHVGSHQIHAQGPMFGYASGTSTGSVMGGVVYSVHGGGCSSRISEKIDIVNNSGSDFTLQFKAMGYQPDPSSPHGGSLEVPDLSGLNVSGTTTMVVQGRAGVPSIHDPNVSAGQFAPMRMEKVVRFEGFNTARTPVIPNGALLTIATEINVGYCPLLHLIPLPKLLP
jgi:hypothetical protein